MEPQLSVIYTLFTHKITHFWDFLLKNQGFRTKFYTCTILGVFSIDIIPFFIKNSEKKFMTWPL